MIVKSLIIIGSLVHPVSVKPRNEKAIEHRIHNIDTVNKSIKRRRNPMMNDLLDRNIRSNTMKLLTPYLR